jgi:hypothetical protein
MRDVDREIQQKHARRNWTTPVQASGLLCSAGQTGNLLMDALSFAQQHLGALQLDDSSIALIALLAGMFGGYWINGRQQLKARRAEIARRERVARFKGE